MTEKREACCLSFFYLLKFNFTVIARRNHETEWSDSDEAIRVDSS